MWFVLYHQYKGSGFCESEDVVRSVNRSGNAFSVTYFSSRGMEQ